MVDLVAVAVVPPVLAIIVAEVGGGAVCGHSSFSQPGDAGVLSQPVEMVVCLAGCSSAINEA